MLKTEYCIKTDLNQSVESVWKVISNFSSYPNWNSMLHMDENDDLLVGKKFRVTIIDEKGNTSKFKAKTLTAIPYQSFSAQQIIMSKWVFSATHYFILERVNDHSTRFIQKWELTGILSKLFRKQIFSQLALFNRMNHDLKNELNKRYLEIQKL